MVVLPSRRALLSAAVSATLVSMDEKIIDSVNLSDLICNYTPREFRLAVAETKRLLYRGESNVVNQAKILAPEPDLLQVGTYEDPSALEYFQCLEKRLNGVTDARPSTGHIATSDEKEASRWGEAVSVWPLGTSFSYVWPVRQKVFFPSSVKCPNDNIAINHDLAMALEGGHEVLFTCHVEKRAGKRLVFPTETKSSFLALPKRFDRELFQLIQAPSFVKN